MSQLKNYTGSVYGGLGHLLATYCEAKNLALEAMKSVAKRDVLAGRYIDLAVITDDEAKLETITLDI